MPDKFQTINIPKVGPVNFPSEMSDSDIHDAVVKNYPELFTEQRQKANEFFDSITPKLSPPQQFGTPDALSQIQQKLDKGVPAPQLAKRAHIQRANELNRQYHASPESEEAPVSSPFDLVANPIINPAAKLYERTLMNKPLSNMALDMLGTQAGIPNLGTRVIPQALETNYGKPGTLETGDSPMVQRAKGVGRGVYGLVGGATTPENLAALAGATMIPEGLPADIATAAFTSQMGGGAAGDIAEAIKTKDRSDMWQHLTQAGGNAAFAGLGMLHGGGRPGEIPGEEAASPSAEAPVAVPPVAPPDMVPQIQERRSSGRKRVADMTPEELKIDALTSQKTGLPNGRAFHELQEDKPAGVVGYSDVNGLKYVNDNFGHAAGDALIKAKGDALKEAGVDSYHISGDEFAHRHEDPLALQEQLEKAKQILADKEIPVSTPEGPATLKGASFTYGFGADEAAADLAMNKAKGPKEQRGGPGNIQVIKPEATTPAEQPAAAETPKVDTQKAISDAMRVEGTKQLALEQLREVGAPKQQVEAAKEELVQAKIGVRAAAEAHEAAKSTAQEPQAVNPPTPEKPSAHTLEPNMRKLVTGIMLTKQLQKAAKDRLSVEEALQLAGHEKLIDPADPKQGKSFNEHPLADKKIPPSGLSPKRLEMVESVANVLGKTPKDLYDNNYRISDEEFKQLQTMLKQGQKPMPLKAMSPDHPANAFSEVAPHPLADINEPNARMVGLPGAKDLYRGTRGKVTAVKGGVQTEAELAAQDRGVELTQRSAEGDVRQTGVESVSSKRARSSGAVQAGKDIETLQQEHDFKQQKLNEHLKRMSSKLQEMLPNWRQARIDTPEESKLAVDISKLSRPLKAGIPKELYAKEHLSPKASASATSAVPQEPIQSTETAATQHSAEGTGTIEDVYRKNPELVNAVDDLHQAIEKHGENAVAGTERLFSAVMDKYRDPTIALKAYQSVLGRYQNYLDKGTGEPVLRALADLDKLTPEGGQATLHANPIGEVWKKLFGFKKAAADVQFPQAQLGNKPIEQFTADIKNSTPKIGAYDDFKNFMADQKEKMRNEIAATPGNAQSLFARSKELAQSAWDVYKTRPGLTPLQWALGARQLRLQADAIAMHRYLDTIMAKHPILSRREAMVNYLQAGGGVQSDRTVGAILQLQANSFGKGRMDVERLKQGYLNAMKLTPEEKQTIADYRKFDSALQAHEKSEGLELHAHENYIRQMWDKDSFTRKKIDAYFSAGSFTTTGAFMKERKFETYFEGEMAGLKPHKKDFAYLVGVRARASAEVLANKAFVEQLYKEEMPNGEKMATVAGVGVPQGMVTNPDGTQTMGALLIKGSAKSQKAWTNDAISRPYVAINHPAFQNWKWVGKVDQGLDELGEARDAANILYKGSMLVHPDVAPQLKRILEPSALRTGKLAVVGKPAMRMSSIGKQTLLIGLFHPVQLGVHFGEHLMEGSQGFQQRTLPNGRTYRSVEALNPFSKPIIDLENDTNQQQLVIHGMKVADFNAEAMWDEGVMSRGFANGLPYAGKWLSALHDGMFTRYIPNLKMAMGLDALDRNISRYQDKYTLEEMQGGKVPKTQAAIQAKSRIYRMTAEQMNAAFGGLNWENLPISKTGQDIMRLTVLAPDFLLARAQFVGDALRPGGAESAKALVVGAGMQYLAARAFNGYMNDGDTKNDLEDWNKFVVGHHSYSLRTVQGDMIDAFTDPRRFLAHRMNPLTLRPATEFATQKDVFGHPASGGQMLYDFAKNFVPMPLQGGMDTIAGKNVGMRDESIADTIMQSLGIQRRKYRTPAERDVFAKFDNLQGNPTTDDLALEQKNSFRRFREEYEKGKLDLNDLQHGLDNGTFKESQLKYLFRTANETRLVREARQLQPTEVLHAWDIGNDMEKLELTPIAFGKMKQLPPEAQQKAIDKLSGFLDKLPEAKQEKLFNAIQTEINYEYPPPPDVAEEEKDNE